MVPRLLHHDPDEHVLIMSDTGLLPDLWSVFSVFGGDGTGTFLRVPT